MLITKSVKIEINKGSVKHYLNKGYKIKGGQIAEIKIIDLPTNSGIIVKAKCDICGKEKDLPYQYYNNSIKHDDYFCCSRKCSQNKRKSSLFKNYGVNYPSQSKEIKEKIKEVNIQKYGVEHNSQRLEIKEKKIETTLKNYGVENPSQSDIIKLRKENTSMLNFGVKYYTQNTKKFNEVFKIYLKKYKKYDLHYQSSYELHFLDFCENISRIDEISDFNKGLKYIFNNKNKIYFPDFFIKKLNLIIEIKSSYWYNKFFDKNQEKIKSCEKLGYKYLFIIDKDYSEFLENYASKL